MQCQPRPPPWVAGACHGQPAQRPPGRWQAGWARGAQRRHWALPTHCCAPAGAVGALFAAGSILRIAQSLAAPPTCSACSRAHSRWQACRQPLHMWQGRSHPRVAVHIRKSFVMRSYSTRCAPAALTWWTAAASLPQLCAASVFSPHRAPSAECIRLQYCPTISASPSARANDDFSAQARRATLTGWGFTTGGQADRSRAASRLKAAAASGQPLAFRYASTKCATSCGLACDMRKCSKNAKCSNSRGGP